MRRLCAGIVTRGSTCGRGISMLCSRVVVAYCTSVMVCYSPFSLHSPRQSWPDKTVAWSPRKRGSPSEGVSSKLRTLRVLQRAYDRDQRQQRQPQEETLSNDDQHAIETS